MGKDTGWIARAWEDCRQRDELRSHFKLGKKESGPETKVVRMSWKAEDTKEIEIMESSDWLRE